MLVFYKNILLNVSMLLEISTPQSEHFFPLKSKKWVNCTFYLSPANEGPHEEEPTKRERNESQGSWVDQVQLAAQ